jgi:hypothetical protein
MTGGVEVSREFLRFAETYVTNKLSDPNHSSSLSFNSALQRIPGTLNSKYIGVEGKDAEVKIIQKFSGAGKVPDWLIMKLKSYLTTKKIRQQEKGLLQQQMAEFRLQQRRKNNYINGIMTDEDEETRYLIQKYAWIETLLKNPIDDNRYFCLWKIIGPYLRCVRKLSREDSEQIAREWLSKCDKINKVKSFELKLKTGMNLSGFWMPLSIKKLIEINREYGGQYDNILKVLCRNYR